MSSSLFRTEALVARSDHFGSLLIYTKPWHSLTALVFSLLVGVLLVALFYSKLSIKISAPGYIDSVQPAVAVKPRLNGVIRQLHRQNNDWVEANQPIVTLESHQLDRDGIHVVASQRALNQHQLDDNHTQLNNTLSSFRRDVMHLREQLIQRRQQQAKLAMQATLYAELGAIEGSRARAIQTLTEAGYHSELQLLEQRQATLNASIRYAEYQQIRQQIEMELSRLYQEFNNLGSRTQDKLHALQQANRQLLAQQLNLDVQHQQVIRAPIAGRIVNLVEQNGQTVDISSTLFKIEPAANTHQAKLFVPAITMGQVAKGQTVSLQFSGFDHKTYGTVEATISEVNSQVFDPLSHQTLPIPLTTPSHLILADLSTDRIGQLHDQFSLQAGLTFIGKIHIRRTPLFAEVGRRLQRIGEQITDHFGINS